MMVSGPPAWCHGQTPTHALGYPHVMSGGGATTGVLASTGNNAMGSWVMGRRTPACAVAASWWPRQRLAPARWRCGRHRQDLPVRALRRRGQLHAAMYITASHLGAMTATSVALSSTGHHQPPPTRPRPRSASRAEAGRQQDGLVGGSIPAMMPSKCTGSGNDALINLAVGGTTPTTW